MTEKGFFIGGFMIILVLFVFAYITRVIYRKMFDHEYDLIIRRKFEYELNNNRKNIIEELKK